MWMQYVLHLGVGFSSVIYVLWSMFYYYYCYYVFLPFYSAIFLRCFARSDATNHFRFLLYCWQRRRRYLPFENVLNTFFVLMVEAVSRVPMQKKRDSVIHNFTFPITFYWRTHLLLPHREWVGVCVCVRELIFIHFTSMKIGRYDDVKVNTDSSVARSWSKGERVVGDHCDADCQKWPHLRNSFAANIAVGNDRAYYTSRNRCTDYSIQSYLNTLCSRQSSTRLRFLWKWQNKK